ncbi:MAG: tellurium resistance protein [Rhodobacteraceae bacterium]|nr:tellurium resistance protein [Paracoccaceae bacterium]
MKTLFLYGSLRHIPLLETVLGRRLKTDLLQAELPDHQAHWAADLGFPFLAPEAGQTCPGLLLRVSAQDQARLAYYEGGFGYDLRPVTVRAEGAEEAKTPALAWFTTPGRFASGGAFDLDTWVARRGAISLRTATELMSFYGLRPAEEAEKLRPMIEMRAASRLMGEAEPVPDAPGGLTRADVVTVQAAQPYTDYFAVEQHVLRFRQFDGQMGPDVKLASFKATDAALVLPYDPVRDRVMMVEQFRMGPYVRGDRVPWQLEPIAGRVDAGETPEQTARREAHEEAGLELLDLRLIMRGYPSPGCMNEYYHIYLGLADLPDGIAGVGGLDSESENIRSHIFGFDQAMQMFERGELRVVPLVNALLWLARHREHLRAAAQGAG